ncbi:MAG: hypothetical protein HKN31_04830, partial [Pricia sp.]|nr:hypothetical protein [Pricia sp.]
LALGSLGTLNAQDISGVYFSDDDDVRHELKIEDDYLIHSVYAQNPAKFIKTVGGYYQIDGDTLNLDLEFNSDFEKDGLSKLSIPISMENGKLIFHTEPEIEFQETDSQEQELDGTWLFATRGPDEGQDRRGEENTRKTLKFLKDNRFQWIAYDTESMKFSGTGGGSFSSKDGAYIENIEYFSRDDSRVGAKLEFQYELKGDDWHHTGKNSKGEPMYEIWARR